MPIIGEIRTSAVGPRQPRVLDARRARTCIASAPPFEKPTRCSGCGADAAAGFAHREPGRGRPVLPLDVGEPRRHRAVPGRRMAIATQPRSRYSSADVPARCRASRSGRAAARRRPGRAVRLEHVGAVPVVRQVRRVDRAAVEVPVELHGSPAGACRPPRPDLVEGRILGAQLAGQSVGRDRSACTAPGGRTCATAPARDRVASPTPGPRGW